VPLYNSPLAVVVAVAVVVVVVVGLDNYSEEVAVEVEAGSASPDMSERGWKRQER
jgi:hypothetical protein